MHGGFIVIEQRHGITIVFVTTFDLTDIEARVLGALIEKDITTPDYYPLSLNALVNACNQKNNRDPVMNLDENAVRDALHSLQEKRLAGPAGGADSRVTKYEHRIQEVFNFTRAETAVMDVLLLRGPQTPGELRGRTERMYRFEELTDVQSTLQRLMQRDLWMSGKRPGQYAKFIELLNEKGDALAAGREAFGDLDKLNAELNAYLTRRAIPVSKFSAAQLRTPSQITFRPLTAGEAAILPFRMQSLIGVDDKTAPPLADAARPVAAKYPNDTFVQRAMAEMEYDAKHYDAADAAADRALAADPKNLMAMAYKGRIALQRARQSHSAADWQAARGWFIKANKVEPNHPLPFELYYDSFVVADQVPPQDAVAGIYRAVEVMPQDTSLRVRAAVELIRAGNIKRARTVLAPAAFYPHAAPDNPGRKLIEQMDKGASSKDLLAYADKEKVLLKVNEFTGPDLAKEDQDKNAGKDKGKGKT